MRLHGGDAEVELGRDVGVGEAAADRAGDLELARAERRRAGGRRRRGGVPASGSRGDEVDQPAGDGGGEHRVAGGDQLDRADDLGRRRVLEQEAGGARAERPQDQVVGVEGGQHQDRGRGRLAGEEAGGGDAVEPRHADVHQDDVGAVAVDRGEHLVAVVGLGDDLDRRRRRRAASAGRSGPAGRRRPAARGSRRAAPRAASRRGRSRRRRRPSRGAARRPPARPARRARSARCPRRAAPRAGGGDSGGRIADLDRSAPPPTS